MRKDAGGDESVDRMDQRVDCFVLYREYTTQELSTTVMQRRHKPIARHVLYAPREAGRGLNPRPLDENEFNQSINPTWQGLAATSRSSTSLPVVGSDSWVHPSLC